MAIEDIYVNNCEFIQFLKAPQLRVCLFKCDKITNLKPFAKINTPSLKNLDITQNLV